VIHRSHEFDFVIRVVSFACCGIDLSATLPLATLPLAAVLRLTAFHRHGNGLLAAVFAASAVVTSPFSDHLRQRLYFIHSLAPHAPGNPYFLIGHPRIGLTGFLSPVLDVTEEYNPAFPERKLRGFKFGKFIEGKEKGCQHPQQNLA
jgi:hypothetical protein